ncbi:MAG: patatin-like phospholipase family protein [Pseudomonadota bacterium]
MTTENLPDRNIAIVCQGGGSHAAYAAGALQLLLPELGENGPLRLVGISGTSGGAICALLGWYGNLEGGPATAQRKLERFWLSNCAQLPGEKLWNDCAIQGAESLPYEILFSPYQWPMEASLYLLTSLWPTLASYPTPLDWSPYQLWGRGEYFQLDELIKPHVDFELIAALGALCSIPDYIARWKATDLHALIYDEAEAGTAPHRAPKHRLEDLIRDGLAQPDNIRRLMDRNRFAANAPLRKALGDWQAPPVDFGNPDSIDDLNDDVSRMMVNIPQLLLGAVDVGNGEFVAFSSQRALKENGISLNAVLASAALPWLFKAVEIESQSEDGVARVDKYWDGLFSQNPPIQNFISGSKNKRKPDEFWVVQINPVGTDVEKLKSDIWDRRNELSGNLSLNQEIFFISAINKRIEVEANMAPKPKPGGDPAEAEADKHVIVHRIIMDGEAVERKSGKTLGALSKFDRDAVLGQALREDGREQARRFLLMRATMLRLCDDLERPEYDTISANSAGTLAALRRMRSSDGGGKLRLIVDETFMPSTARDGQDGTRHHALARWHASGGYNGKSLDVEGETEFDFLQNGQLSIQVKEIRIASIDETPPPKQPAQQRAGAAQRPGLLH